jgi:hypothetical protein
MGTNIALKLLSAAKTIRVSLETDCTLSLVSISGSVHLISDNSGGLWLDLQVASIYRDALESYMVDVFNEIYPIVSELS